MIIPLREITPNPAVLSSAVEQRKSEKPPLRFPIHIQRVLEFLNVHSSQSKKAYALLKGDMR